MKTENTFITEKIETGCMAGRSSPVSSPVKYVYIIFGVFFFSLGAIRTVLPLIPTTPLIILAAICFGKSSRKLHMWCVSTKFYKSNVDSFVKKRAMTIKAKVFLLTTITAVMGLSFYTMIAFSAPIVAKIVLIVLWLCHMAYFGFVVKITK